MFNESIDEKYIVMQQGTSEGTQIKYYKDGYWYKKDNRGNEGYTEYLVSKLLTFSDLEVNEFVSYESGKINEKNGCRSKNFLGKNEELVTLYRLYFNEFGRNLSEVINKIDKMEERIEYVLKFVYESCQLDLRDYFKKVFTLDMLVLNEDRHFNNLALIFDGDQFKTAPIFDNGVSLLTANQSINWNFDVSENVRRVVARPFSGSHEKMYEYFGKGFNIDIDSAMEWLEIEKDSMKYFYREIEVLIYQLKRYEQLLAK